MDDEGVWLCVPRDILKLTAPTAVRLGISSGGHSAVLASFLVASGADIDEFSLSQSTAHRYRMEAIQEVHTETREEFRQQAVENDWFLTLHLDGKMLEDTIGPERSRVVNKRERLNVTLTTPMLESSVFVASKICENGSGQEAAAQSCEAVEELGVMDQVWALGYDTTASNSSPTVGAAALIEEHRGCQLLKCPCRMHILDLFGKNLSVIVSGQRSTGPSYPLFVRYARDWPDIRPNIDYTNLRRFDMAPWRGTFLEPVVLEVQTWVRHAILAQTFKKGTHRNLLKLIAAYLGVTIPGYPFRFNKPETIDNARFGQRANIYLTIYLLSRQLNFLTTAQTQEVSTMALLSALLIGPSYLKAPLLARASYNDLTFISHLRQLRPFLPDVSAAGLRLWERHLDYLTPQHIPWSLVNDDFSNESRKRLATKLLSLLDQRVDPLLPTRVSYPGPSFCTGDQFWPRLGDLPALEDLATLDSFLAFNILELSNEELREWWEAPVEQWTGMGAFVQTKVMATKIDVTNDNVESSLKGLKDTIEKYHGEEQLQQGLTTLFEERKRAPAERSGKISKTNLKKIVKPQN